ncbi:uncharacterized protein LOC141900532 [Tubulanus polymorphus]|uniref:uncharacterized protein LOC141900532 n=1 Tax=Tubulanus polymorphus TaxID=672921 RepID=UPI003DA4361E
MGNIVFPNVGRAPVSYESAEVFSPTGERFPDHQVYHKKSEFKKAIDDFFQQFVEERRYLKQMKLKFRELDPRSLKAKFPNWETQQLLDMKSQFLLFDLNKDGLIDFDELCTVMNELGDKSSTEERQKYFSKVDTGAKGKVDVEQFLELLYLYEQEYSVSSEKADLCFVAQQKGAGVRRLSIVQQVQHSVF